MRNSVCWILNRFISRIHVQFCRTRFRRSQCHQSVCWPPFWASGRTWCGVWMGEHTQTNILNYRCTAPRQHRTHNRRNTASIRCTMSKVSPLPCCVGMFLLSSCAISGGKSLRFDVWSWHEGFYQIFEEFLISQSWWNSLDVALDFW